MYKEGNSLADKNFFHDSSLASAEDEHKVLTVTSASSVQPAILLRLGVFVPNSRALKQGSEHIFDVSEPCSSPELARKERTEDNTSEL